MPSDEPVFSEAQLRDRDRLKRLMLYIAWKEATDPRFGETKFNKLLFFANAFCLGDNGKPLTHFKFQRNTRGPTLRVFERLRDELVNEGRAFVQVTGFSNQQFRLVPKNKPQISDFTSEEIAIIDAVIDRFSDDTGTGVSEFSHKYPAWKVLKNGDDINPESVFVIYRNLSERELLYAVSIAPKHGGAGPRT